MLFSYSVPSETWRLHRDHLEGDPAPTGPEAAGMFAYTVDHVVDFKAFPFGIRTRDSSHSTQSSDERVMFYT